MMMSHLFPLHAQAVFLAARIEAYWHSLGHENVKAWPIEERVTKTGIAWGIRSNLINGLPTVGASIEKESRT